MDGRGSNVHILDEAEQRNAAHFCQQTERPSISKVEPTYTYFLVELGRHQAVVEIAIIPSTHPKHELQTVYSIRYRYALCCSSISGSVADEKVRKTVSNVVGAKFLLFGWDFSDQSCYTRDLAPSQVSEASCSAIASKRLRNYITSPGKKDEKKRKRPHIEKEGRPVKKSSDQQEEEEQANAEALVEVIRKGLSQLALMPSGSRGPRSIGLDLHKDASYVDYAARLILLADKQVETQIALSWFMRFLAGCVSLASPSLPARPATTSSIKENRAIVRRQKSVARFINMIVSGLWDRWRDNAFIVYHAFAVLDYRLKNIQTLGHKRQSKIARKTVELLHKAGAPALDFGEGRFDPSQLLCRLLKLDSYQQICNALQLPPLPNVQLPVSTSLIDAMSNRLQHNVQPRSLSLTERAANPPQSPYSTERDSHAQEIQTIDSQATLSAVGHDMPTFLHLTERVVSPQARSSLTERSPDASTESDSHAQEIQAIDAQATLSSVRYDTLTSLHLAEQVASPPAPPSLTERGLDARSSMESDSQVQESQVINSQATPAAAGYDTQWGVERQESHSQGQEPPSVGHSPLHEGQTSGSQIPDTNSIDALQENDVFFHDVIDMTLGGNGNWNSGGQTGGPRTPVANGGNALPEDNIFFLDVEGMVLRRDEVWNPGGQTGGPWALNADGVDALPENVFSLDVGDMTLRGDGDGNLYTNDILPAIRGGIQTDRSRDLISWPSGPRAASLSENPPSEMSWHSSGF